ncbi:MAG: xylose ABC transporter ATP-binding protein [Acidobacteria bacterium]|nr:MAG: xylose ABC transporter ATP-binding protein [Acidobacteriota bacterium]REK01862.1 MAG: xylose ABC transporter ATP-binding protein [Acidobacteriota bacterium]REK14818.1 MAG: xylose ABC transporter ATP-binding protein [Acidobacteriota bacterium]REK45533.1 MAG: xylose ABC transporter ATP-binding protein [Acidobacteriota bacterium]
MSPENQPLLEMRSITKEFPGVKALDSVNLDLYGGEFHALVGENGAGKSTLMKILSGVYPYGVYEGEFAIDGDLQQFHSISEAKRAGIAIIFQELSLVKELSVGENIFLGREPSRFGVIDRNELYHRSAALLRDLNMEIDPTSEVGNLGIGQQQLVEIAKALAQEAKILVLDEPTAALTDAEVKTLFDILERLKARGVGMIYISHKLEEVFRMSDRITVLRDGNAVGTYPTSELDKDRVIALMVGREVGDIFPEVTHQFGEVVFEVNNLTVFDPDHPDKKIVDNLSFSVRKGEVLGIAGLMGAGRSESLMAMFGAWRGSYSGDILVDGRRVHINSPKSAIASGIGFVTEDRKRFGLILDQTIQDNSTLACLEKVSGRFVTHRSREKAAAKKAMEKLKVKANSPMTVTGTLSGGNQQKVVLGKWLLTKPKVLFLDEPTRGIDVGAKQEIYSEINSLAEDELAIVMISSELPEVLGLSDRVIVLHEGRKTGEFTRKEAKPEAVMAAATGQTADREFVSGL